MSLKVLLIANYAADKQQSMQRYAALLERTLRKAGQEVQVIRPPLFFGRIKPSRTGFGKWLGYIDKFVVFPVTLRARARDADIVHICDHSNAMYSRWLGQVPVVVTCHDMLSVRSALGDFPEHKTGWTGRRLQSWITKGLATATHIVCVSAATLEDVRKILRFPSEQSSIVYHSLHHPYSPLQAEIAERKLQELGIESGRRYLLHVGGNNWYKNRLGVLRIFDAIRSHNELDLMLVLAGAQCTEKMKQFITERGLEEKIRVVVGPDNEQLQALYSSATALLFPSWHEGFGWPLIEAQACGCPVVTSDREPMTEIAGEGALYIDPLSIEQASKQLVTELPGLGRLRNAGFHNLRRFGLEEMVNGYLRAYRLAYAAYHGAADEISATTVLSK